MTKHVIIARHPEHPGGDDWTTIHSTVGNWEPPERPWRRRLVVAEEIEALIMAQISYDLTVTDETAEVVMAAPDATEVDTDVTVFCPVKRGRRYPYGMWVLLRLNGEGQFEQGELANGKGVVSMLRELGDSYGQPRGTVGLRNCLQVRPHWCADDFGLKIHTGARRPASSAVA